MRVAKLFDAAGFVKRSDCGGWTRDLAALSQLADGMTALAFFLIPLVLMAALRKKSGGWKFGWLLAVFLAFLVLCGLTHVCQILAFHWPAYRLFTILGFLSGLVSLLTAALLPLVMRRAYSGGVLEDMTRSLRGMSSERETLRAELHAERTRTQTLTMQLAVENRRSQQLHESLQNRTSAACEGSSDKLDDLEKKIDSIGRKEEPPPRGEVSK